MRGAAQVHGTIHGSVEIPSPTGVGGEGRGDDH